MTKLSSPRRRAAAVALAACLALAGCGSQLDPADLASTSNGGQPVVAGGEVLAPGESALDLGADGSADLGAVPEAGGEVPSIGGGPVDAGGSADAGGEDPDGGAATDPGTSAPESQGGGPSAASCDGFDNDQPGVTPTTITVANIADISGPVPGIFESARQATKAYITYFNATQKVCGRSIKLLELDSRADAGADQQAYARACVETFAAVGSMSAFDSGGAATAEKCGLPDVRSTSVNPERSKCKTCFSAQSLTPGLVPDALPDYFSSVNKQATQNVALLYVNAGAAPVNAASFKKAWETRGWKVNYFQGIDVAEFNFAPYVQQMKDRGTELVYYVGPYQNTIKIQQAMKQQGFKPDIYLQDSTIYDARYVEQAGDVGEGSYAYSSTALFDDMSNPEMKLYRTWLEQVSPGADPNFFGAYAWSSARLFLEAAVGLGGDLTRPAMVAKLAKVEDWTGNGLHGPQTVGPKATGKCLKIIQLTGGSWKQVSKGNYLCGDLVSTGLGD